MYFPVKVLKHCKTVAKYSFVYLLSIFWTSVVQKNFRQKEIYSVRFNFLSSSTLTYICTTPGKC